MINVIFRRLIAKWISPVKFRNIPFNNQSKFFFSSPLPIVGAFITGLCLSLLFAACSSTSTVNSANPSATSVGNSASNKAKVVRFGYQKTTTLLRAKGVLEKRLTPEGITYSGLNFRLALNY